jgi:hypothetical protein
LRLGYTNNHRTVVYPVSGVPLIRHSEVQNDISQLHRAVQAAGGLALPQHATWTPTERAMEPGVEVTSAWGIYIQQSPSHYHRLLDLGHPYAFMGHSDSHRRNPGLGGALTGVYAEELTDRAIIEAIRDRRMFATNGSRIFVDSRANRAFMGRSVLSEDGAVEIVEAVLVRDGVPVKSVLGEGRKRLHVEFKEKSLPEAIIDLRKPVTAGPLTAGFDTYFGVDITAQPPYCFLENDRIVPPIPDRPKPRSMFGRPGWMRKGWRFDEIMPTLTERSVGFIRDHVAWNREKPFFLYIALTAPHVPIAPSAPFREKTEATAYGDFVSEVEACVGTVMKTLEELEIRTTRFSFSPRTTDHRPEMGRTGADRSVRSPATAATTPAVLGGA